MKNIRLFLFLTLLFPILLYAEETNLTEGDCKRINGYAVNLSKDFQNRIKEYEKLKPDQRGNLDAKVDEILGNGLRSCKQANFHLDEIVNDLQKHSQKKWRKDWQLSVNIRKNNHYLPKLDWFQKKWIAEFEGFVNPRNALISRWSEDAKDKIEKAKNYKGMAKTTLLQDAIDAIQNTISPSEELLARVQLLNTLSFPQNLQDYQKQLEDNLVQLRLGKQNISLEKAIIIYTDGLEKAELAIKKEQDPRPLKETDKVVKNLNDAEKTYKEAILRCSEASAILTPFPLEKEKADIKKTLEQLQACEKRCKNDAEKWPKYAQDQKINLKTKWNLLQTEKQALEATNLTRGSFEIQKRMIPIAEALIECEEIDKKELSILQENISKFEILQDSFRLTKNTSFLTHEEFELREKKRRQLLYADKASTLCSNEPFLDILQNTSRPCVIPLTGQNGKNGKIFSLYAERFYQFLVQSDSPILNLSVKVYENDQVIHEEKIPIPQKSTLSWKEYLINCGKVFIPETKLQTQFGIDLHLEIDPDQTCKSSVLIKQKGIPSSYRFSVSLEATLLYEFNISEPLPWQLKALRKPNLPFVNKPLRKTNVNLFNSKQEKGDLKVNKLTPSPILVRFIEDLKSDPLLLVQYVYNEIDLVDPFIYRNNGILQAPPIHRSINDIFLEKQGSPWEQCMFLVYLLREAGFQAVYAEGDPISLPKYFVENMLSTKLDGEGEVLLNYPWVRFYNGENWISLFPWMKDMQVETGDNLYSLLPKDYASPDLFILRYLTNDEEILKHVGPDGDDTLGVLFTRFVEEELRKKGASLQDVGVHRSILKKQYVSWNDFLCPTIKNFRIIPDLNKDSDIFAKIKLELSSAEDPKKKIETTHILSDIDGNTFSIRFSPKEEINHVLHLQLGSKDEKTLFLGPIDQTINVKLIYDAKVGNPTSCKEQTLSFAKGTSASLCLHFGGTNSRGSSLFLDRYTKETNEEKKVHALLSYIGEAYFEKCCKSQKILANLHNVTPKTIFAFGLAKLSPDLSEGPLKGIPNLKSPQVDMIWFNSDSPPPQNFSSCMLQERIATRQFLALACVDQSSQEHQVLKEAFKDPYAVSTVKLLQLAHLEHQKKGLPGVGFLVLSKQILADIESSPEIAKNLHFPHLTELNFDEIKKNAKLQWAIVESVLGGKAENADPDRDYALVYMTPNFISSQDGNAFQPPFYKGMGTLVVHPTKPHALLSDHARMLNGGIGSPLSSGLFGLPMWSSNFGMNQQAMPNTPSIALPPYIAPSFNHVSFSSFEGILASSNAIATVHAMNFTNFASNFSYVSNFAGSSVIRSLSMPNIPQWNAITPIQFSLPVVSISSGSKIYAPANVGNHQFFSFLHERMPGEINFKSQSNMNGTTYLVLEKNSIPSIETDAKQTSSSISQGHKSTVATLSLLVGSSNLKSDVRLDHKSYSYIVGDPVDVVTGAFYVDELDLTLPGPFPLEIRRNYNNQNTLPGILGCGWKLSLNPFLVEEDGKIYAAEKDGTIIVYRHDVATSRWIVDPEDNPDLSNFNKRGIGSTANPFHAYIEKKDENKILYGCDGSKRIFENNLLKKWIDHSGNTLTFTYNDDKQLDFVKSSNGSYLRFSYTSKNVYEIEAKDGRKVSYEYDAIGNLAKVTLPNDATICYEYDHSHQIIRETKPLGRVLENVYDDMRRVIEQRTPVGLEQQIVPSVSFEYIEDGQRSIYDEDESMVYCITRVKDSSDAITTYKIFNNQIYKIIDPLGYETLQSWFINEFAWFDAETETILPWKLDHLSADSLSTGAWPRSLKSTTDKRGLTTYYLYDSRGNPIEIGMEGKDLTGSGDSHIAKKFTYNAQNLCTEEEVLHRRTVTTYDLTFAYLPKRIEKYYEKTLLSFVDLEYSSQGQIKSEKQGKTKDGSHNAITEYAYDERGFPTKIIQKAGATDPDVVTEYEYNLQGQCVKKTTADSIQENKYDLVGNCFESEVSTRSGKVLSATHSKYNLNNQLIEQHGKNLQNAIFFDYNASGLVKTFEQVLTPSNELALTLYDYDTRDHLIKETNPLGVCTYREYDALGRVISVTKEDLSTTFTYEAGGLLESTTSPGGAKTTKLYTTNGLLKKEIYADDSESSLVYDFFGRVVRETKNGITFETQYDDENNQIKRTHVDETGEQKFIVLEELDERGNIIRTTDAAGAIWEQTFDGLNRLTSKTSPTGEKTTWSYKGDSIICTLPSGEKTIQRYEAGQVASEETFDAHDTLIAQSSISYDLELDIQTKIQGEIITTTWMNTFGKPIQIKVGELSTHYEYDACGNCISFSDAEGRITKQEYDALGRIIEKILPDGAVLTYVYDADSHLIEYHLPGGVNWIADYDLMGRKCFEKLEADGRSSQVWNYIYENGHLIAAQDPMERIHKYLYDSQGRRIKEDMDGWQRLYTYDPRGLLLTAEEIGEEKSLIKRSYDKSGRLTEEIISLNSETIQETKQTWNEVGRTLQIGDHIRSFFYQNGRVNGVWVDNLQLSYAYDTSGALIEEHGPFSSRKIQYNKSALPERIHTQIFGNNYQEFLGWNKSGKLASHRENNQERVFTYTSRGHLQSALVVSAQTTMQNETYEFDFDSPGLGIRTAAPTWKVQENGLDPFGKICNEEIKGYRTGTHYDDMGQITSYNRKELRYDPWGRLTDFYADTYAWKASYDALGRRIQTIYTPIRGETIVTNSLYDPETEFQEIGVQVKNKIFWKIYGPNSCDAIIDENGSYVQLVHNALNNLTGVLSEQGISWNYDIPSAYGPQGFPYPTESTLLGFAKSLTWQSKSLDPTGLIWMGARYYDPVIGRFISPDPISYPMCLDLYTYAGGDPINYYDPDGRFDSPVYKTIEPTTAGFFNSEFRTRLTGSMLMWGGAIQMGIGTALTIGSSGFAIPLGGYLIFNGADNFVTGMRMNFHGQHRISATDQLLIKADLPPVINGYVAFVASICGANIINAAQTVVSYSYLSVSESRILTGSSVLNPKNVQLNRFHQAASNLSEAGKNNIRILRSWAESRGWEKLPNPNGGPEKWGTYKNGKFEWNLRIKPEASFRPGLEAGSNIPRFDARLDANGNSYINPFTPQNIGSSEIGTHIPLE
ncbi:MAG: hypothetical protein HKM07_04350 [Chlamydiae bacterium]|nr:hypothetical protein [Chlamydiota bacterium]